MPEFILDQGSRDDGAVWFAGLSAFAQGYVQALFFTNQGSPEDGNEIPAHYSCDDISHIMRRTIERDCNLFTRTAAYVNWLADMEDSAPFPDDLSVSAGIDASEESAGMDFWYTRNGHGVGFWEGESRGYPGTHASALDEASKAFGEVNVCLGDDGKLYLT